MILQKSKEKANICLIHILIYVQTSLTNTAILTVIAILVSLSDHVTLAGIYNYLLVTCLINMTKYLAE